MKRGKTLTFVGVVFSFLSLFGVVVYLVRDARVTVAEGGLMLVALFGLYIGFGILIAVYRLIGKLE